jgi:hypothetical protein
MARLYFWVVLFEVFVMGDVFELSRERVEVVRNGRCVFEWCKQRVGETAPVMVWIAGSVRKNDGERVMGDVFELSRERVEVGGTRSCRGRWFEQDHVLPHIQLSSESCTSCSCET